MTIRFTKTEKWDDPWFRNLNPSEKVLFLFLCDRCDCAGFWEIDGEAAMFHTKIRGFEGALEGLKRALLVTDRYVWVKNFVRHQKNLPLNPENRAHRPIIARLEKMQTLHPDIKAFFKGPSKGLPSPTGKGIGKGKSKGIGYNEEFLEFWAAYPNKTGKGKAWESWQKAKPPLEQTIIAVEKYKLTQGWQKDDGQYIPNPATFLNQRRWEDEPGTNGMRKETLSERAERFQREKHESN